MNIVVYSDKTYDYCVRDTIGAVTSDDILQLWKIICKPMIHRRGIITRKDQRSIQGLVSHPETPGKIGLILASLTSLGNEANIPARSSWDRIFYHLIAKCLGMKRATRRKQRIVRVWCDAVDYWGSFTKALSHAHIQHGPGSCGCDKIPARIEYNLNIGSGMDYDDRNMFYDIPRNQGVGIEFSPEPSARSDFYTHFLRDIPELAVLPDEMIWRISRYLQ